MVIDFHTHAFPDKIAAGALEVLTENTRRFASIYGESRPHHDGTLKGLAASSKQGGIDVSLILPIATSPKPSHSIGDFGAAADKIPGLRSFGSVHPRSPVWREELERQRELGLLGIKLHPEYQGCYADEPETIAVVKAAGELGLWWFFTQGWMWEWRRLSTARPTGRPFAGRGARYPDCPGPSGRGLDVGRGRAYPCRGRLLLRYQPLGSGASRPLDLFGDILRTIGPNRVLFGTDSPWTEQKYAVEQMRVFLDQQRFTPEESAAILGGNAAAILQIQEEPT